MPKIGNDENMQAGLVAGSKFGYSGTRIKNLGATEYTLVEINVDVTGSTQSFADELRKMLITAVNSCKKSPRSDNLLVRVCLFSTYVGIQEVHGFMPLAQIDPNAYPQFTPDGMTNLFDASFSGMGALVDYGGQLTANDFLANAIQFDITDGADNASTYGPKSIRDKKAEARRSEKLESILHILVGINAAGCKNELEAFTRDAEIDQYIDAGDATPGKLAKLAAFVSQSVSSQSQALGTGGPSQAISATI